MDASPTTSPTAAEPPLRTPACWAATCAALAVSAMLMSAEPARAKAASSPTIQAAKWAAQPSTLLSSAVADGTALLPMQNHQLSAPAAARFITAPAVKTIRLAARTRSGGRHGP